MKKSVIIVIIVLALLVSIYFLLPEPELPLSPPGDNETGNDSDIQLGPPIKPPTAPDCSDSSIQSIWDSLFQTPSTGITIIADSSDTNTCDSYYAYKQISTDTYLLGGAYITEPLGNLTTIVAMKGDYTSEQNIIFTNLTQADVTSRTHLEILMAVIENVETNAHPVNILSTAEAATEFTSVFFANTSEFVFDQAQEIYSYYNIDSDTQISNVGAVAAKNSTVIFMASHTVNNPPTDCTPSWINTSTNCTTSETYTVYYIDENNCDDTTGYPGNATVDCDNDDNGIIGDESSIDTTNIEIDLLINGEELNLSETYNTASTIELNQGNITRVSFDYSFTEPLNLNGIYIKQQTSSASYGYLIINGISEDKTIKIDKKYTDSSVCILEEEITNINDITDGCSGTNENSISCPGTGFGFECEIEGDLLVISGLVDSAVKEISGSPPDNNGSCTPEWNCTTWSPSLCPEIEVQTRTCPDNNACNITSSRPDENRTCDYTQTCTPNWNCTSYIPLAKDCPENKTRYRTCADLNNCETPEDKPPEETSCTYKASFFTKRSIIMIIVAAVILITIIILYILLGRYNEKPKAPGPPTPIIYNPPARGPPRNPMFRPKAPPRKTPSSNTNL